MNILLVCQNYYPLIGGVETQVRLFAQDLAERHEVRIAAGTFRSSKLPKRVAMLHTNLLAPAYEDYLDGAVPVHALTPGFRDRLRMLPIAVRAVPRIQRHAY